MLISHHRWSHALAAGLLLAGCKSTEVAEPAAKAQATAPAPKPAAPASAPSPASKPAAPAPAPSPAAISDGTLSYLEQAPDQKCRWVQHTPPGEPKTVFTFPGYCGLNLAWKPDGREALVSNREWNQHDIFRVDLAMGQSTLLSSLPSRGVLGAIGFDTQGRTVALMEERYEDSWNSPPPTLKVVETDTGEGTKKQFLFEGQRYDLLEHCTPGLAHAFRLDTRGQWMRFETKSTSYDAEGADHYRVLDAFHAMAPTSINSLGITYKLPDVPEDSPDFAELSAVREPSDIGGWKQLETAAGPLYLYIWRDPSQDPEWHTALARIRGETGLVEPEGLSFTGELSAVNVRGDLVLLQSSERPGGRLARLWNAKTKKLVASLPDKDELTFWPKPLKTPAAAQSSRE